MLVSFDLRCHLNPQSPSSPPPHPHPLTPHRPKRVGGLLQSLVQLLSAPYLATHYATRSPTLIRMALGSSLYFNLKQGSSNSASLG